MRVSWEIFGSAIVIVGDFNPAIFSPDWMERHGLIGSKDAEAARANEKQFVISHQATSFSTDWFGLQVLDTRLIINNIGPVSPAIRDLAVGLFTLLPHVPVNVVGMNFMAHYRVQDLAAFHLIGDTLAPKDIWTKLYPGPRRIAGLERLSIRIENGERDNEKLDNDDRLSITVENSNRIKQGVFFNFNAHRDIQARAKGGTASAQAASDVIRDEFEPMWKEAIARFDDVLRLASGGKV